jgi:hypothetical protein
MRQNTGIHSPTSTAIAGEPFQFTLTDSEPFGELLAAGQRGSRHVAGGPWAGCANGRV